MVHNFKASMASAREDVIDEFLKNTLKWELEVVTREEQRKGIDRIANKTDKIEYKTEWRVTDTGNFFIETISNDTRGKPGWIVYSEADTVIYYLPNEKEVWLIPLSSLKAGLVEWEAKYPKKQARNKGYSSHGIVVPKAEIEKLATSKYTLTITSA